MKTLPDWIREARRLRLPMRVIVAMIQDAWQAVRSLSPEQLRQFQSELQNTSAEEIMAMTGSLRCKTCGKRALLTAAAIREVVAKKQDWQPCCGAPMAYVPNSRNDT